MVDIVYAKSTRCNVFLHMHKQSPGIIRTMTTEKRPHSDRGQGRKPISSDGEAMRNRVLRMSDAEWAKCLRLGGAAWVRDKIAKARESK